MFAVIVTHNCGHEQYLGCRDTVAEAAQVAREWLDQCPLYAKGEVCTFDEVRDEDGNLVGDKRIVHATELQTNM